MSWWQPLKGVLNRHYADWQVQNLASISGNCDGSNNRQSFFFFNQANPAVYFYVYGLILTMSANNGSDDYGWAPAGTRPINQTTLAYPIISNQNQPPGTLDQGPTTLFGGAMASQIALDFDQHVELFPPFPLFVLAPNTGVQIGPTGGHDNFFLTLFYVWK